MTQPSQDATLNVFLLTLLDEQQSLPAVDRFARTYETNGAALGAAALCSPCGRHLAMMPHPERCVLPWQWPYLPPDQPTFAQRSPWRKRFENAAAFLED